MMLEAKKKATLRCWVAGLAASLAVCVAVFGFARVKTLIDDVVIMRALSGFSGAYPSFLPFTHSLVVWPLVRLHQWMPSVHWYSWMLVGGFYGSLAVIVKCLLQQKSDAGAALPLAAAAVLFALLWLDAALELTFTNVSTLLGCAALAQLLSFDAREKDWARALRAVLLAAVLAAFSYVLRMENLYPVVGFCGLAFLTQCFALRKAGCGWNERAVRRLLACFAIPLLLLGLLAGWRAWECSLPQNRENMAWQDASEAVLDYTGMENLPDELLNELNWTREGAQMFQRWYFLDHSVSTQAFEKIAAYQRQQRQQRQEGFVKRLAQSQEIFWRFFVQHPALLAAAVLMLGCCAAIFRAKEKHRRYLALFSLFVTYLLLSYLAFRGRFLMRAVLSVLGPEAVLLLALLLSGPFVRAFSLRGRHVAAAMLLLVAIGAVAMQAGSFFAQFQPLRTYRYRNSWSLIDEYAMENPDKLFVVDSMADDRLFPDMKGGQVTNVLYYGGWQGQDDDFQAQLRRYGIDPDRMDGRLFLQSNICLASLSSEYAQRLRDYIGSLCQSPVEMVTVDRFRENLWVQILQFRLKNE